MKITDTVASTIAGVLDVVSKALPASWAVKVANARKAVVATSGSVLTVVTAVHDLPFVTAPGWVAYVVAAATAAATYLAPNEK